MNTKSLAITHPYLISFWHPILNGSLTPFDISFGSHKKVWWKCDKIEDHEWLASVCRLASCGEGCPCCRGSRVVLSNCLATTHPNIAKQWHPTLNGNLTPFNITAGSNKKVWWKCNKAEDHEWLAQSNARKISGCPFCAGNKTCKSNCLVTTHPEVAAQWHPNLNGQMKPFDISFGCNKKVWWQCEFGHIWEASVANRCCHNSNCPECKDSKGEIKIKNYLTLNKVKFKKEFCFSDPIIKNSRFDFRIFDDKFDGVIEYHGSQHYIPKSFGTDKSKKTRELAFRDNIKRDYKKEKWCLENNVKLFVIPFWDFENVEVMLDSLFEGRKPKISLMPNECKKYQLIIEEVRHGL